MKISRTPSFLAAALLVAGLSLSACGDKDSSSDSSSGASSPSSSKDTTLTQATFTKALTDAQLKAGSAHVAMSIGVGGQTIDAKGDVKVGSTAAETAMGMTMDLGQQGMETIEMRLVDQVFYLDFGPMTQNKFVKIDLTDTSSPFGKQFSELLDQMDPSKQLEQIQGALTSVEKKGATQKIDGVDTQPYEVTVDTKKIPAVAELGGAAGAKVPATIVYTMFVGPDNLPRRMVTELAGAETTIDYSKWGEPVDIKAPPAKDVSDQDVSSLLSGAAA
jgi:hypothetical protein